MKQIAQSRLPILKASVLLVLGLVFLFLIFIAKWSFTPTRNNASLTDPAVVYMNANGSAEAAFSEAYFEYEGKTLHYVEAGEGELIFFLHGFPSYWFSFTRQMEALKGDYHVIAIDGLGAGKSDAPLDIDAYKLENMAAHLNALIDHMGAEKVHLVGHDWGSAFAIGFAQRYPGRIHSVTGISAPPQNVNLKLLQSNNEMRKTAKYIEQFKQANPPLIVALGSDKLIYDGAYRPLVETGKLKAKEGALFQSAMSNPKRINAHINWYRANIPLPEDITEADFWPSRNARVAAPALYIWGEDDMIYNKDAAEKLQNLSDEPKLILLPKVGHWPHVQEAEQVTAAIRDHIAAGNRDD